MNSEIIQALKKVIDPELNMNIVDIGLIYDIQNEDGDVTIGMTLTTPGCPLKEFFISEIETVLFDLQNINDVHVEFIWSPPWDLSMMDENAKHKVFNDMRN